MSDKTYDVPSKCKAGVVVDEGPNFRVEIAEVDVPKPGPNDLLIRLNTTGLCYSDIHLMMGDLGTPPMSYFNVRSPGHEGAGIVVALGANVTNWSLGDRVGVKPIYDVCHKCELCWADKEPYCPQAVHTGLMVTGSYQQYVTHPARYASPIPDGVDDTIAGPVMCSASTIYRSIVESGLKPGDIAAFPGGAGGVGIQGVQLAKAMGLRPIVIDSGDAKRELSMKMGAEAFVDFKTEDDVAAALVKAADGKGAHGVFVTAPAAYKSAIALTGTRVGAKVMCIGLPAKGTVLLGEDPGVIAFRNLTIKGTLVGTMKDTSMALDFAKRGLLKQICEVVPLKDMPEAVQRLRRGEVAGRIVVDFNA
ncbi:alcohol dehydrogenase [Myriangium duriaei CBS 260.36]|uniref:Alcohol dehydrogenase n=1 Tax=Myriangium duriaei CBS 260.36 TaxID=1168546 RepID=A0A9P4MC34_9PEZI|nr:alcohol dehydrogenase [Myriangium duriaei CBS 260.36]